ncbi:hypothetical protein ACIOHF_02195 [Streptomyces albidoflavus]
MTSALLLSWVAIALLALVVSGLVRQVHQLSRGGVARVPRHPGVTPGSPAPHAGELLDEGQETLLLFLSAECRTCAEVLDEADRLLADDATPAPRAVYAGAAPATSTAVPVVDHRPIPLHRLRRHRHPVRRTRRRERPRTAFGAARLPRRAP